MTVLGKKLWQLRMEAITNGEETRPSRELLDELKLSRNSTYSRPITEEEQDQITGNNC